MSEAEITNAQYLEFLNAAFNKGLVSVTTGTSGADKDKKIIVGTASSSYSGKVLYSLDGTRVMKDHNNTDGDNNAFSGKIEPENPLNIAYIGYDSSKSESPFYVKDPHSATDFHWYNLCTYNDFAEGVAHTGSSSGSVNDFSSWSELSGWSESNPSAAASLPTKATISSWPATFIRWWGARAFALFYDVNLPSEAQWEYAAKGGNNYTYAVYNGTDTSDANWNQTGAKTATGHVRETIRGKANPFGLYNLGGNAWEWIEDNYKAYDSTTVTDPVVYVPGSTTRSWRGGSWNYHQATLESSGRYSDDEDRGNDHFGFRIVIDTNR